MVYCSRSSGIQHHAWFDSGYVFLRKFLDDFGYPSFVMSHSFRNHVLAHFVEELEGVQGVLRSWKETTAYKNDLHLLPIQLNELAAVCTPSSSR